MNDTLAVADQIPSLDLPVRLIRGTADRFQNMDYGYRLASDLRAPMERIEGGIHFVPEDHHKRVTATVGGALEQMPPDR